MPDLADFPDVVRRPVTRDIGANNPVVPSAPSDAVPDVLDQAATEAEKRPEAPKPRVWRTVTRGGGRGGITSVDQPSQRDYDKYQSAMDRFNARSMLKAGREQERQINVETSEALGQQRIVTQKNPETGLTEPARDEAGNIRYRPGKEPVQYDASGKAIQTQFTPTGPKQVELDKDAEIGPHPDYPHQLFKQNANAPWDFVSTVGEGLQSDDDKVRKAAEDAQLGLDKEFHGTALKTLGQNVYESAQKVKGVIAEASGKQQTLKDLQAQAAQLEPQSQLTEGGLFGMGKRPTSEAQAAKTKLDEVNAKIADLSQQGYGRLTGKGTLAEPASVTDARKGHAAASAEKASWSSLKIDSLGQLDDVLQAREAQILANDGDPESDPVIASIKARKKELGVEAPTAQPSAEEQTLREHPTFGPLMQERDQLTAESSNAQKELDGISSDYDQRLQPIRDEITLGQNQIAPIQTRVDTYTARLEKLLGMPPAQPGEDLQVRRDEASQRISNLTDPQQKARVQTVLNALEPAAAQLRKAQADLEPTLQAHDALQEEAQQRIQTRQQELNDTLTQRHADLSDRWNAAQNAEEQQQWNDTVKRQSQGWFDETKPTQVWNPKNEQIRAWHPSDIPADVNHQVARIVDALFAPGEQFQHTIISPETAKFAASVAGLPARLVTSLMGAKIQSAEKGTEEGIAKFLSGVSLESIASLPVFLIPGVAQTYAAGLVAKLPDQYGQVKDAISAHGFFSKETAAAITENGITDVLGFLGLRGAKAGAAIAEKIAPETVDLVKNAIAEAKKNGVSPEFRAFFGGIDPEVAGTTPEKVQAFAKSLGMEWKPEAKTAAAPEPVAPTPADAHAEIDSLQMPGRTPEEHEATQNALRGLVKISQGQPIVSLTAAEKRALVSKATPEGTPRIEIVKGNAIISDATLARVAQIAPTVRSLLPENEEAQRQKIIAADTTDSTPRREQLAPEESKNLTETPQPAEPSGNLPSFSVEVQNAKGETTTATVEAPSAREAHAIVARQIPAGQGLIRSVERMETPNPKPQAPIDFVERAVESAWKDKGSDLTESEVKQTRVVARVLKPHYDRWAQAFSAVTTSLKENKTGGVALTSERALHISIPDVIRHANLYKDTPQHAANQMLHEAAHSVTTAAAEKEIVDLWKEAPKSLRDAMKQFYKASGNDYNLAHEYWAYFLAGRAELAAGRRIRLAGKFLPEQSSRKFITENRRALARVLRFVRNAEAELKKAGKSAEYIAQWKNLEKLFVQKLNEVDGHSQETSKEVTPHETLKSNVPIEPSARGPPGSAASGRTEPERVQSAGGSTGSVGVSGRASVPAQPRAKGAARAPESDTGAQLSETRRGTTSEGVVGSTEAKRDIAGTPTELSEEARTPAATQLGRLQGEDRRTLATSLGVPETALGGVSAITQNGRTIQVAYVAQEAAQSRTSHDAQGRATPGYDQGLQPRDRSLPQYRKQSQNIANNLEFGKSAFFPETKTPATTADLGAPIMTRSGDTLVGNGREIGIKTAYQQGLSQAARYKSDFIRNARTFGIDPATVRDMAQPILKRVITGDVPKADLIRFSQESNEPAAMGRNAMELAGEDAGKLTPQLLSLFDPNYAVDSARNRDFVRSYLQQVVGRGTEVNEANLTGSEVARRIRAAVFTYAYGADQTGRAALERLAGEEGSEGKTITNGMLTVAPIMARLRADVASGDLHAGMDISTSLTRAAQTIAKSLQDKPQTQSAKAAVESLLSQGELFGQSQLDYETLKFLVNNRNKRTVIEEGLSNYAEAVYRIGNPKEGELFAGREVPTSLDLFKRSTTDEAIAPKTDERRIAAQELQAALKSQPLQTFRDREHAFDSAERAKPAFDRQLEEIARATGTRAITAPIKSRETASAKVATDYNGDWSKIKDLVRGTIAVRDMAQARKVVGVLAQRFGVEPKRDFTRPLASGYRDALFNPIIDGHMAEIQVQIEPIVFVKDVAAHPLYERERAIKRQAKTENRQLSAQELRTVERLTLAQRRIYAAAFAGHIEAGISSTASEGLQGRAPSDLISPGSISRGSLPSKAHAFPSLSTTIPQGFGSPGTSIKDFAPGKAAIAASSVIPPSTTQIGGSRQPLFSQQLSLFGDAEPEATAYAKTLPAAAKASKPALKREVARDVPALADNDAALDELVELAQPSARVTASVEKAGRSYQLSHVVQRKLDEFGNEISSTDLFKSANEAFGGTQANGFYTPKDAYDAVEMAVNRIIAKRPEFSPQTNDPVKAIADLKSLIRKIPTQTKRTAETDEFQQFSTVPPLAFVANWVGNVKRGDVVLEPSAGVGGLAAFAQNVGAKTIVNEISKRRLALLELGGHDFVTGENAEQINNLLPQNLRPNVVIMNPPFSSTAGRMQGARDTENAIKHLQQALDRLEPGGRLVAIVGEGMALDRPSFKAFWDRIQSDYDLRANVQVNGEEYAKYGTTWDNQIVVIDKPSGEKAFTGTPLTGRVERVEDLIPLLEGIRNERPESIGSVEGERGQPAGSPERAPRAIGGRKPARTDVGRGGGVPATTEPGVAATGPSGERVRAGRAVTSGETGAGLGERQSPGEERISEREPGGGRSVSKPDGLERAETTRAEAADQGKLTDAVFDSYQPRITVPGATMPPIELQESSAMASVEPVTPTYRPAIPKEIYQPQGGAKEGRLSAPAMESVILAGNQHEQKIPLAYTNEEREAYERANGGKPPPAEVRAGMFIGDGTGVGKGRQVMGIVLDNWLQGRKKAIWITEKPALINDAKRDADDVAQMGNKIFDVAKVKLGDKIPQNQGIAFVSYATLRSEQRDAVPGQKPASRVQQLIDWFGEDFDGVIALDESHNLSNNVMTKGSRGMTSPSAQALAGLDLQRRLPNARIVYMSATGATEVSNLGYAERLGLWGPGTPFADKRDFISKVSSSGVAGMELVARDMKALGKYVARAISWRGVTYDTLSHPLSPEQREIYDSLAEAWQGVLARMDDALEVVGAIGRDPETGQEKTLDPKAKAAARSAFWGAHQRFFNQVITSMKMPTVLKAADGHLAENKSVVLQLVNTNEAAQNRAIAARQAEAAQNGDEADLEDLDMTPRDVLMQMVERSFPVAQREQYTDEEGNLKSRIALDSKGQPIINPTAIKMREALLEKLGSTRVPDGPLEMLLNHFGKEKVSEITGRTQRVVWGKDKTGNTTSVVERRSKLNGVKEASEFMDGKRRVLVFSNAGGTGRSYHADLRAKNQEKRVHILIQPGWQASRAVQGFGRTHRNNQKQPPHYQLATSDVVGEKRFMSSIARRLDQLGALTKGSRQTASQGLFNSRDNLESPEARAALQWFYRDVMSGAVPEVPESLLAAEMGLKLRDKDGQTLADLPPITQFLNRLLSLKLDTQRSVFDAFSERLDRVIDHAISTGTLDQGMENLTALSTKAEEDKVIHTDQRTGAQTRYVKLNLTQPNDRMEFPTDMGTFYRNKQSGRIYAKGRTQSITDTKTGKIVDQTQIHGIVGKKWVNSDDLGLANELAQGAGKFLTYDIKPKWESVTKGEARGLWEKQYAEAPETRDETVHFITGTILPVWDRVQIHDDRTMQVRRVQTDDGKRMIGLVVWPKDVPAIMKNFGQTAESAAITPEAASRAIFGEGANARLSNGWRLKRSRVAGENRIELIGPDFSNKAEMDTAGVFSERIQYNTRYFVPTNKAIDVIQKLTASRPIVEINERPAQSDLAAQQIEEDQHASKIGSAESLGLRSEGLEVGQETPLRQPGEIAGARETEQPAATEAEALRSQPVTVADRFRDNLPLAMKIAASYRNIRGVELGDIQQHARMALLRASRAFDPQRGLPFSALARQSINNELRNLYRQGGRLLEDTTLDEALSEEQGAPSKKDLVTAPEDVRAQAALDETSAILESAINELPQRMQGAMAGILDGRTLDDIGQELGGISRQAVGKLATEAMRRLRGKLGERGVSKVSDLLSQPIIEPLYHVTDTGNVESIKGKGLLPMQPSNWVEAASKKRYGGGDIYAFDNFNDAVRWAGRMDFSFNKAMGTGKISVVQLQKSGKWAVDTSDPLSQAGAKGTWLKRIESVSPEAIGKSVPVTKEMIQAVVRDEELSPEKYFDLLSQMIESELKAQTTDDPLEYLMSILKDDPIEALRDIPGIGRPDLALGATAAMRAVHEFHTDTATPQKLDQWDAEGKQIVADRGPEWVADVTKRWLDGAVLEPSEVRATQQYILEHQSDAMTPEDRRAFDTFAYAYTKIGERTARELAARRDPFQTPEQRNREFLAKALVKISPAQERELEKIKDHQGKTAALENMISQRRKNIDDALREISGQGVTIDDILSGGTELRLKGAKIIDNQLADYSDKERQAIKLAQTGTRSASDIAKQTGLTAKQVEDLNDRFISELEAKLLPKTRAGATLQNLDAEQIALLSQPSGSLGAQPISEDAAIAEARKMIRAMGFVSSKDLGRMKIAKRKRPKLFVPPKPVVTGEPVEPPTPGELPYPQPAVPPYTGRVLGQMGLPLYQKMMVHKGADLESPDDMARVGRIISAANGNAFDMAYELWINGILSGPATQVANITGNALSMALDFSLQRGMESLVNLAYRDPKSAQLGEFKWIVRGFMPGMTRAITNSARAWQAEADFFRNDVLNEQVEMFESFDKLGQARPSIPGRTGHAVRMPGRALVAMDSAFKGLIGQMEVNAVAYRIAKSEGLKGAALSRRINELAATPNSEAWQGAVEKAVYLTYQEQIPDREHGGNWIENAVANFNKARAGSHALGFFFPFIRTPFNIFRIGLRKTPLGSLNMAGKFAKAGFYKLKNGRPVFESYEKAKQIRDFAEQLIAWLAFGVLWGATTGDDNDEKKPLLLIGSFPRNETKQAERELNQRAYGGEYQIRIGGRNGVYINYGRFEPIATVLGTVVDTITNVKKMVKYGQTKAQTLDALHGYFMAQAESKTFLQGFGEIADLVRGKIGITDFVKKQLLSALVPNIIRQPLRNLDQYMREQRDAAPIYQALPIGALAEPRRDVYGQKVEKGGFGFTRLFFPSGTKPYSILEKADSLMLNWNRHHPQTPYAPSVPQTIYKDAQGKDVQMTPGQSTKFLQTAGRRFAQMLRGQITDHQIQHPSEDDIKRIKELHSNAVEQIRREMFPKRSDAGLAPLPPKRTTNIVRQAFANAA